jgi:hypothetical protein
MNELCNYAGNDTTSVVSTNEDSSWFSRCHCGAIPCASGTYEEAVQALIDHRAESI